MKKQIITGLANFDEVVQNKAIYIDKTLFVRDVFYSGSAAMLILRPRRWGKSLNMQMLKYFLEAPLKKETKNLGEIDLERLEEKKEFFKDKKLLLEHPEMREHLGQYSVISVSLSGIQTTSEELFLNDFGKAMKETFKEKSHLLPFLSEDESKFFHSIVMESANQSDLSKALKILSSILRQVYKRPVWLLLDEYDSAVNSIWERSLKRDSTADELLDRIVSFFGSFYESSVKLNEQVYRTIFTGVFRVLKGSMGTSMNNFSEFSMLDKKFARDFGFHPEEIEELFDQVGVEEVQRLQKREEAKTWYNGYQSALGPVYNPWSIMYWLDSGEARSYWVNMGSLDIILAVSQYSDYSRSLSQLLLGESIQGRIQLGLVLRQCQPGSIQLEDAFWTLLAFSGYISIEKEVKFFGADVLCELRLPNLELKSYFQSTLSEDFRKRYGLSRSTFEILIQSLLEGRVDEFETQLKSFLRRVVSVHDVGVNRVEAFYQGFFLGMISACDADYVIRSDFASGRGRADLLLIPRENSQRKWQEKKPALILEYKVRSKKVEPKKGAKAALRQTQKKDYLAEVEGTSHVDSCFSVGISFYGKDCTIQWSEWKR